MGKFLGTYMQTCIIKILGNNFQQQLQHPITKKPMQNQKKPIQQKKPMQNFTAEKWADKIALFIDNFGFLSGFF